MFCFHNWGKWSHPINGIGSKTNYSYGWFQVSQMRICGKCGLAQVKRLPQLRSLDNLETK
jgi:hypothetical protein